MRHRILALVDRFRANPPPVVAVLRLEGIIASGMRYRQQINIESHARLIEAAFSMPRVKAVALAINSPGGSPVQSALVMKRIRDFAKEKDVPVIAFAEDVAASGGYFLALAGDEIYAHEASIVGSIGVIYAGFGLDEAIAKLGIARRLYTAGEKKSMLDPFSAEKEEDVKRLKGIQGDVHEYFKSVVRDRRGRKLKGKRAELFSGDVWTGEEALKLGLIDGIGEARAVLRERFGEKVRLRTIAARRRGLLSMLGFGRGAGQEARMPLFGSVNWADDLLAAISERTFWGRWGL